MTTAHGIPDLLSPEFLADPYPAYSLLRERSPLLWHEPTSSYVLSRYDDVRRVFQDREGDFCTDNYGWQLEPVHGRTILQLDGRDHSVRRALVAPAFRGRDLRERFLPVIERNSRALIDAFRTTGRVDLVSQYATRFPINVIVDVLGLDQADHDRFHDWYTSIIAFLGNLSQDPGVAEAGLRTRDEFAEYMLPIIAERRENPGDDLLSRLCLAEVDGTRMTDGEVKAFCSLLLAAGGETTDKALASLFANLIASPDQLAALREDRSLIPRAFAESLRFTPPVQMIMRQAVRDVRIGGGTVPAGATVTCLIGAANRDPDRFAAPDTFDLFRTELAEATSFSAAAEHLSFALGRHFCVGALLAEAEVRVGVNDLLDAMPDVRLAEGAELVEQGLFTRGLRELPVEFSPVPRPRPTR
ncbi:pulcherriminic acid synthase [Nocardiopsis terrae]|uniref:Pulcherriminic acid synthase n=1 Tax=Nocardiopsis terrae TaxID=372655 RepID=A0ABR9HDW0_9ACTN|nr:cytochrome P450 [Nocardiopsis terrae]MBE1457216.1 pulcherriminic acid synthase [Nocardiopsis terrae]